MRHALSELLQRGEVRDDVIETTVISVSEVRMSPDLKVATAFVSPLGAKDSDAVIEALNRHARFIRGRMSPALRQMQYMPEFRFKLDTSYDNFAKIDELLRSPEVARDLGPTTGRRGRRNVARRGKKKGRPVSGWVVLDKPVGMGSTEAVSKVKWLFQADKAGHAGTLDPLASGMLPIALGEATKTVPYVMDGAKIYRFAVAWGEERSTDDLEGPVTQRSDLRPDEAAIRALLPKYTGIIMQTPPQFSAVKIAGNRAYDLARDGETVDIPPREVEIGRFDLIGWDRATTARCSRSNAARAPMCARWPATWAATSAASAISPNCAGSRSSRSPSTTSSPSRSSKPRLPAADDAEDDADRTALRRSTPISSRRLPRSTACRRSRSPTMRRRASGSAMR